MVAEGYDGGVDLLAAITDFSWARYYLDNCAEGEPHLEDKLEVLIEGVARSSAPHGEKYTLIHHPLIMRLSVESRTLKESLVGALDCLMGELLLELKGYMEDRDTFIKSLAEMLLMDIKRDLLDIRNETASYE